MIVYSDRKRPADPRVLLRALARGLAGPRSDAGAWLLEAGGTEAGIVDALCPKRDGEPPLAQALGALMVDLAHAARGDAARLAAAASRARTLAEGPLPASIEVSEPEGFAFYALTPSLYAEAARRFLAAERPRHATVLGLRSIGTTLSAVVAAELEAAGVPVRRLTVRPRGHPFDRELRLTPPLQAALAAGAAGHVLVVDEGPGLSGSSFAAAAEAAAREGTPDHRIHLFPSWDSDGAGFRSDRARAIWPRHRRWVAPFEDVVRPRLAAPWGGGPLCDLSGGLWRDLLPAPTPAVQPQHERRKYRLHRDGAPPLLLKFTGLGPRGARMLARAEAQAEAGLAPHPEGIADGFLALRWVEARPPEALDDDTLAIMSRHLAHLAAQAPAGPARFDDLLSMTRLNVTEGLGEDAAARLGWMEDLRPALEARPALAVDGRMMPHEWLRTGDGLLKADGLDHHDDHFWPGTQDIAWDLAGAAVEWDMDQVTRNRLLDIYEARTGDREARNLLPFHETAYLAFRLGYATLAAETLGDSPDGRGMAALRDRYAGQLRGALARGGAP